MLIDELFKVTPVTKTLLDCLNLKYAVSLSSLWDCSSITTHLTCLLLYSAVIVSVRVEEVAPGQAVQSSSLFVYLYSHLYLSPDPVATTENENVSPTPAVTSVGWVVIPNLALTFTTILFDTPLPSLALTVMVAIPGFRPVTNPAEVTVATDSLFDDQLKVLFVAFSGWTSTVNRYGNP